MAEKRYVIVRVDNSCPEMLDDFGCIIARNILHCKCGEDTKNYGDTKEQLIRKVAQVIFKNFKNYNGFMARYLTSHLVSFAYKIAKEIVEFLGVEE